MKRCCISALLAITSLSIVDAQEPQPTTLRCLEMVLFEEKVFDKVFFQYTSSGPYRGIPPSGKCAFILPDSTLTHILPDLFEQINWSWPNERMIATTAIIKRQKDTVFTSLYFSDIDIELWIRIDHFDVSENEIQIQFHTTDFVGKTPTKELRYYRINSAIKRHRSGWRLKATRIEEIGCCDDKDQFLRAVKRF